MLTRTTLAAALAFVTLSPACGPGEPGDSFREGEACMSADADAACRLDGEAGLEFCEVSQVNLGYEWSTCLTEACEVADEARACEGGGQQFCVKHWVDGAEDLRWAACTDEGECTPGETQDCGLGPEFGDASRGCVVGPDGVPRWDVNACNTPLVLSFGAAIEFASAPAAAADFDIHGGPGICTRADWPAAATPWLALDRDRSGAIEGGHELFGSGTRLAAGTAAANGFLALAELDSSGDGRLSAADARWGELVLWADHDGDRRSSQWEMLPLANFEVVAIELAYTQRRECDRAGNCGVERASFVYRAAGQERVGEVVDVHLACE